MAWRVGRAHDLNLVVDGPDPLQGADLASLWAAIAADMGASLLVIFNGLRLLRQARWQWDREAA